MKKFKGFIASLVAVAIVITTVFGENVFVNTIEVAQAASKVWNGKTDTSWFTGDLDYYEISTAEQLAGLAEIVNGGENMTGVTIALTNDIVLNKTNKFSKWSKKGPQNQWTPIGTSGHTFRGIFDGQGHSITGLYMYDPEKHGWLYPSGTDGGLFGYTVEASIANLKMNKTYIYTVGTNGAVVAKAQNSCFYGIEVTNSVFTDGTAGGIVGASTYDYSGLYYSYATFIAMGAMGVWFNPLLFGDNLLFPDDFTGTIFYGCKVKGVKFIDNSIAAGICAKGGGKDTGIGAKGCLVMNTTMKTDGTKGAVLGVKPSDDYAIVMDCYKCNVKVNKKSKNKALVDKNKTKNIKLSTLKKSGADKLGRAFENVSGKEPKLKLFTRTADKVADASVYKVFEDGYYYICWGESTYLYFNDDNAAKTTEDPVRYKFTYREGGYYTIETEDGKSLLGVDGKLTKDYKEYDPYRFTARWEIVPRGDHYWIRLKGKEKAMVYYSPGPFVKERIKMETPDDLGKDVQFGYRSVWDIRPAQ